MNKVRIRWNDPAAGPQERWLQHAPLLIGREDGNDIVLADSNVSSRHAMIEREGGQVVIRDVGSRNGVRLNGQRVTRAALLDGAVVQIGSFALTVSVERAAAPGEEATVIARRTTEEDTVISPRNGPPPDDATVIRPRRAAADDATVIRPRHAAADDAVGRTPQPGPLAERDLMDLTPVGRAPRVSPRLQPPARGQAAPEAEWPPAAFSQQLVSMQALQKLGVPLATAEFATVGAGIGSFVWSDLLRVSGVPAAAIAAVGVNPVPYAHYQLLARNSQLSDHERLRSSSEATPDNLWGWPGYAAREIWHDLSHGKLGRACKTVWQVFGEPALADTYSPRVGDVLRALDREMRRIGWGQIYRNGRVRAIRKTDDGRYVIAYSTVTDGDGKSIDRPQRSLLVAPYVHLATGYPAIQFLPDLQQYREETGDFSSVVNAYEDHDHIYEHLRRHGGLVLIRGRGFVASRVIQRIFEERQHNKEIGIIHLLRSPAAEGHKHGRSQREVANHFEFQPLDWPRGCWTGPQRRQLERASPGERKRLLEQWGGATTVKRQDWVDTTKRGLAEGWYKIDFGDVSRVERNADGELVTVVKAKGQVSGELRYATDFVIDATGLDAKAEASPLLRDLVGHYKLELNPLERIQVQNDFEVAGMRNSGGRMYAAGAMTLGGPNAGVDTFLGLQYAAYRSVDALRRHGAAGVKPFGGLRSLGQWLRWAQGRQP